MTRLRSLVIAAFLTATAPLQAFELSSPVACALGESCYLQQYVDHDPGPGARDTTCRSQSYDGHKGTDFAARDRSAMRAGIPVLAVAGGTVTGVRDGMADGAFNTGGSVEGRECGNGVAIRHAQGWRTQYCHLREGSVSVREGQKVRAGETLGLIGMSGRADFPHLHLQLSQEGAPVDPFDATEMAEDCTVERNPLWSDESGIAYVPGGIIGAGMLGAVPDYAEIKARSPSTPSIDPTSETLVFWAHFHGIEAGDELSLRIVNPGGQILAQSTHIMEKSRAREMRYTGKRRRASRWPAGRYRATATLSRGGSVIATREAETVVGRQGQP